jgi:hypothetical protein
MVAQIVLILVSMISRQLRRRPMNLTVAGETLVCSVYPLDWLDSGQTIPQTLEPEALRDHGFAPISLRCCPTASHIQHLRMTSY